MRAFCITAATCLCAGAASASDLTVSLPNIPAVTEQVQRYQCGPEAARIGLPTQPFPVTYLDAGDNHLAVIEIRGARLVFVSVGSGSTSRYETGRYTWWDSPGRGTFLAATLPSDLGGMQSVLCQRVAKP
jgi:membrane-bound inhibitor of C-type lysozyme